jgi:hypothetical protein
MKVIQKVGGQRFDKKLLFQLGVEVGKALETFLPDQRARAKLDPEK